MDDDAIIVIALKVESTEGRNTCLLISRAQLAERNQRTE